MNPGDINDRIVAAIAIAFKEPKAVASLVDEKTGVTYGVSFTDRRILKISVGNGAKRHINSLLAFLSPQIGEPSKMYVKESSLYSGQMISYMEWANR